MTGKMPKLKSGKKQMGSRIAVCLTSIIFILNSCSPGQETPIQPEKKAEDISEKKAIRQVDSCKTFLKNGSIVLRRGNDVISEIFSQLNKTNQSFSHCGIAFNENNVWYVYHSIGGEDNPDERMRKDTYENFVISSQNNGFGICDLSLKDKQVASLHSIVDSLYTKKVPFDMQFDLQSNDRLYCAEMVYKAIQKATNNDAFFTVTLHNGFKFVSTDNIFVNKQAQMLCHVTY